MEQKKLGEGVGEGGEGVGQRGGKWPLPLAFFLLPETAPLAPLASPVRTCLHLDDYSSRGH